MGHRTLISWKLSEFIANFYGQIIDRASEANEGLVVRHLVVCMFVSLCLFDDNLSTIFPIFLIFRTSSLSRYLSILSKIDRVGTEIGGCK